MFSFFFTLFDGAVRAGYHLVSGFAVALTPIFAAGSRPLAGWTVPCGEVLRVAAVQELCAE
jgi:hypothetical protein